jgi:Thiol-disulfide isomerase and thioredoxins
MWKKMASVAASAALIALSAVGAFAQSLGLGDPAPKLTVKEFVKGKPITEFAPDKTYVVEFWATWCGPCKITIPHLTKLQKQYKDVQFVGVSIWENDQSLVKPFVQEQGDNMDYTVCMDVVPEGKQGNEGAMALNWMQAAGENGIPSAFIIKGGKIQWIGHPMQMDKPLEQIVAGTWNVAEAAEAHKKAKAVEMKQMELNQKLGAAIRAKDHKQVLSLIDQATAEMPEIGPQLSPLKFETLRQMGDEKGALALGEKLIATDFKDNPMALNSIAWSIVDPESELKPSPAAAAFALKTAKQAVKVTEGKDAAIMDTLATAYWATGDKKNAIATQEKAVALAKGTQMEKELAARLAEFKKG